MICDRRYVWFGFKVWYIWACWRAASHTTAALARAVHTFSRGATKRQSEQKDEDVEETKGNTFHHHGLRGQDPKNMRMKCSRCFKSLALVLTWYFLLTYIHRRWTLNQSVPALGSRMFCMHLLFRLCLTFFGRRSAAASEQQKFRCEECYLRTNPACILSVLLSRKSACVRSRRDVTR
jgi:hypothetical protein